MADLPKISVEEYIARHDDIAELLGREKLSVLMSSVTLPDDLDEKSKVNYEHLKASRQRFSENAWTCLVLSQQGLIRQPYYVNLAHGFADIEGITPHYLRRLFPKDKTT